MVEEKRTLSTLEERIQLLLPHYQAERRGLHFIQHLWYLIIGCGSLRLLDCIF